MAACVAASVAATTSTAGAQGRDGAGDAVRAACQPTSVAPDRLTAMARGYNLVGWLDQEPPRRPSRALIASLRSLGFTHVRLPVDGELLAAGDNPPDVIERRLGELDRALEQLLALDYAVTIDMHPGAGFNRLHLADPEAGYQRLAGLWRVLAQRYARLPASRIYFELLNEPAVAGPVWRAQAERLVAIVRLSAPSHTIVYGGADFQRIEPLAGSLPLADANVVYAVHYYDPMAFTHQGAEWMRDSPLRMLAGVPFPARRDDTRIRRLVRRLADQGQQPAIAALEEAFATPWTEARVEAAFEQAGQWSRRHRRAVVVNEFGVLASKADPADRVRWIRAVRLAAERQCIGWTHWELDQGFGFVRQVDGVPDVALDVVSALLQPLR